MSSILKLIEAPQLSIEGQIKDLKDKGITFQHFTEEMAEFYLAENNNYFKLRAYRKNFNKSNGKYSDLDFGALVDLAEIDKQLRKLVSQLSLDIEHCERVKLLKFIAQSNEDGYDIVEKYKEKLKKDELNLNICSKPFTALESEIDRNKDSEFCGDLIRKYTDGIHRMPVWVFVEIISFGSFIKFLDFCAKRIDNKKLQNDVYLLKDVKRIRNAAAHNNCLLNNLSLNTSKYKTNYSVNRFLSDDVKVSKHCRDTRMSNAAIRAIVTLLYTYKTLVADINNHNEQALAVNKFIDRCYKNINYYQSNDLIIATFDFLKKIIDKTFNM